MLVAMIEEGKKERKKWKAAVSADQCRSGCAADVVGGKRQTTSTCRML